MTVPLHVDKATVRRFLLERQRLTSGSGSRRTGPHDILPLIQSLECVQIDPVAAAERNQHLLLFARQSRYQPGMLEQLLADRRVFEYWANAACVIPMDDFPLFEWTRRRFTLQLQSELDKLGPVVEEVLQRLEAEGPLPSRAFTSGDRVHGYWDNTLPRTKATSHALNLLHDVGRIQVVRREGTTRFFDICQRAVPAHLLERAGQISQEEAKEALIDKYMRAYRIFDLGDMRFGWQRLTAQERRLAVQQRIDEGRVVPLQIEGVKRPYYILAQDEASLRGHPDDDFGASTGSAHRVHFLPPLDNLLWRRERIEDVFDFSYTWEVYIPANKRRYGYYAMPILVGDTIIGRIDPKLDRQQGRMDVRLLQVEPHIRWTKSLQTRVVRALDAFARFHGVEVGTVHRTEPVDMRW